MEKSHASLQKNCLNCGGAVEGAFCHQCGQHIRDNSDRSLSRLFGEFVTNTFFLDNRFLLSALYLVRFPGRMTVEFLEGKRTKFISPITFFLFVNLIYFFVKPLSDYSLTYYDQVYSQPYSPLVNGLAFQKLKKEGLDERAYSVTYQTMSDNISKSIMIINVPMIAVFVYLMAFKRRRFYYDSLIFSFHFFSLFMFSWVLVKWIYTTVEFLSGAGGSIVTDITFPLFAFFLPMIYAMFAIKKFLGFRWYWAIFAGVGVMLAVTIANIFYRIIILILTLWLT